MIADADSNLIFSNRKAINTLFPYAILLEQGGQQGMIDAISRAAKVSDFDPSNHRKFMWRHVVLYISRLFEKRSPTSLNRVIALISPYVPWDSALNNAVAVSRWAAAASTIPYTDEVGQRVVDALLQIAYIDLLRPHIPVDMWGWIKKRPSLPHMYHGLPDGACATTVANVRRLGDVDILKSYFLLIWSDQCLPLSTGVNEMEGSIRKDFGGDGMENNREELIARLDLVLGRLDRRRESNFVREARVEYTKLKNALQEVHRR